MAVRVAKPNATKGRVITKTEIKTENENEITLCPDSTQSRLDPIATTIMIYKVPV